MIILIKWYGNRWAFNPQCCIKSLYICGVEYIYGVFQPMFSFSYIWLVGLDDEAFGHFL